MKDIYLVINKNNDSKINPQIYYLDFDFINGPKLYTCPFNEDGTPNFDNGEEVIVDLLLSAGAIVMGKTATSELAYLGPSKTSNPQPNAWKPPARIKSNHT